MFKKIILAALLFVFVSQLNAQLYIGSKANEILEGTDVLKLNPDFKVPVFISFMPKAQMPFADFNIISKKLFKMRSGEVLELYKTETDELGFTHYRYHQIFNGYAVEGATIIAHVKDGKITSINGEYYPVLPNMGVFINPNIALEKAKNFLGGKLWKWELKGEEEALKKVLNNPQATYMPKGVLVVCPKGGNYKPGNFRMAYKFDLYAHEPIIRKNVFVDALTGEIIHTQDLIMDANSNGKAVTKYSGTQNITADSTSTTNYRLRETGRGNGVETYNLATSTTYGSGVDFTDSNNYWNNVNAAMDEAATDAHFGAETTWDYYKKFHNRNSFDNGGGKLVSYVHYSSKFNNAFWNGYYMTYGDGDGSVFTPLTSLDICGHELSHGVTGNSAGLAYSFESGALNESFSDIFGTSIEFYANPTTADYIIGKECTPSKRGIRNMANPKAFNNPSTYLGSYWVTGSFDNGGVHTNSGVQNHWYYVLVNGEKGTNDKGNNYDVKGIGMTDAARITYRNLTVYLTSNAQYSDARFYSIQAARDLFGFCSNEEKQVTNAWYAVGVGNAYDSTLKADFYIKDKRFCNAPATVQFYNSSSASDSAVWDFGDGKTSNQLNPAHTYTAVGKYTVKLKALGCLGGADSITKKDFIDIDPNTPICKAVSMPKGGTGTKQTACSGYIYDDGTDNNYSDNVSSTVTIAPTNATTVKLTFTSFNMEDGYDFLYIYDGKDVLAPLIGAYTGNKLPNGGTIIAKSGMVTLRQYSDQYLTFSGFEAQWQCISKVKDNVGVYAVKSPVSSRQYSSFPLTNAEKVSVVVKNYGSVTQDKIPVAYNINGGKAVVDTLFKKIKTGDTASFTFNTTADLSKIGNYVFNFWTLLPADLVTGDDSSAAYKVKHIANPTVSLPVLDDFESTTDQAYNVDYFGLEGDERWDFSHTKYSGRIRTAAGSGFTNSGKRAITLDESPRDGADQTNYLTLTLNLENYKNKSVYLDFNLYNHGEENQSNDRVWVRGSDQDKWVQAYDIAANIPAFGAYKLIKGIDLSAALNGAGQSISKYTQIRFGQAGNENASTSNSTYSDGLSFDDIKVWALYDFDATVKAMTSPQRGRQYTSSGLGSAEKISITIGNEGKKGITNIPVGFSVNNKIFFADTLKFTLAAGGISYHTFKKTVDMQDSGNYVIKTWVAVPTDSASGNDTLTTIIRHLPNQTVSLPYKEDFENSSDDVYKTKVLGLNKIEKFDYENTDADCRLRLKADSRFAIGSYSATMDRDNASDNNKETNYLTLTLNLAKYNKVNVLLDFKYAWHNDEADVNDKVWIRGNDKSSWIEIYDLTKTVSADAFNSVNGLDISALLAKNSQKLSTSTQIRFGQQDNRDANYGTTSSDGISIDEIQVYGITNDVAIIAIDSPNTGCGLGKKESVKIKIKNAGSTIQYVTPVAYQINGGSIIRDTSYTPLFANDEVEFTFGTPADFSSVGTYSVKAWAELKSDIDNSNDSFSTSVKSLGFTKLTVSITPSGKTKFCEGGSVNLDAGTGFSTYAWSTTETKQSIAANASGNYSVTVTNSNGCTATNSIAVTVFPFPNKPVIYQRNDTLYATKSIGISYNWAKDATQFKTTTTPWLQTNQLGSYTVTVIDSNGCSNTSNPHQLNSIEEATTNFQFNIYPNPANDVLNIEFANTNVAGFQNLPRLEVSIFNTLGQKVYEAKGKQSSHQLDLKNIPSGVYMVQVISGRSIVTKQVVKY
ncbi:MAG: M4 family metallopeptidase [Bacteroidetes bacterium]|nr:M4 family metallopeptidase [Bacteroidota bacterium]